MLKQADVQQLQTKHSTTTTIIHRIIVKLPIPPPVSFRKRMSGSYVKGYGIDWDKIKNLLGIDNDQDPRIGWRRLTDGEKFNVISFGEEAFGDDLDKLRKKDIPVPEYLRRLESLLSGPDVFEFVEW
ncbi:unnamed protein product [Cyclocybe aegerita]|uniref:Uncharacterized protein n=1 Tax=Cyclocybe aegerita TaxID=1973307 RepID=A0A8S0WLB7_CYCAE|nr:unnamed protein product [Cyclocybe aegerita]